MVKSDEESEKAETDDEEGSQQGDRSDDESDDEEESESGSDDDDDNDDTNAEKEVTPTKPSESTIIPISSTNPGPGRALSIRQTNLEKDFTRLEAEFEKIKSIDVGKAADEAVEKKLPATVKQHLHDALPAALQMYVDQQLKGVVRQLLKTTPITLQTLPSQLDPTDLKGKLYEAIQDDSEEEDLQKALARSMKKKQQNDDSIKKTKPSKRRHDDFDKDDEPPTKEKHP